MLTRPGPGSIVRNLTLSGALLLAVAPHAQAAVPTTTIVDAVLYSAGGGPAADGTYNVTFNLYSNASSAQAVWTEGSVAVTVKGGLFVATLGSKKPLDAAATAALGATPYVGVQIEAEPEMPRKPLASVPFSLRAAVAEGLDCSGCITVSALDSAVLKPYAKTADLAKAALSGSYADLTGLPDLSGYAKAVALAKVATSGMYADLSGAPDMAGYAKMAALANVAVTGKYADLQSTPVLAKLGDKCGTGLVMRGLKADGSYDCVAAFDPSNVPPGTLAAVSDQLLTNQFNDVYPSTTTPVDIKDNNPPGIIDTITVPDVGLAQSLTIELDLVNSDLSTLQVNLTDPNGVVYVLYDKSGQGTALKTAWPKPTAVANGDLSTWLGKNPKGKWSLTVMDTGFLTNDLDGKLNAWSVKVQTQSTTKVAAKGMFQFLVAQTAPGACNAANFGAAYANDKDNALYICNGKDFYPLLLVPIGTQNNPGVSCQDILTKAPGSNDGNYWITGSGTAAFQAYCDMTTDGGGWTLVRNIAPNDTGSVGYNNQGFWTTSAEYGSFSNKFSNDYKGMADWQVSGKHVLIQSTGTGAGGSILGWRRWPMLNNQPRTFASFFKTGIVGVHGTDACETGAPDITTAGSTSSWDDIIRQGSCLYADVNPSGSGEGDTIRLTTLPYNNQDNMMAGFASCIDCGASWNPSAPYMGIDRAACNSGGCSHSQICRMPGPPAADCKGEYCGNTYATTSCGSNWNSRFFVR